jgi:hypothetical protein
MAESMSSAFPVLLYVRTKWERRPFNYAHGTGKLVEEI